MLVLVYVWPTNATTIARNRGKLKMPRANATRSRCETDPSSRNL